LRDRYNAFRAAKNMKHEKQANARNAETEILNPKSETNPKP